MKSSVDVSAATITAGNNRDMSATTAQACYHTYPQGDEICITDTEYDNGRQTCSANLNGFACLSCTRDQNLCMGGGDSVGLTRGHRLHCRRMGASSKAEWIELCGDRVTYEDKGRSGGGNFRISGSSGSSSTDSSVVFGFLMFIFICLRVALLIARCNRYNAARRYRQVRASAASPATTNIANSVELELFTMAGREAPRQGTEVLLDDHIVDFTFHEPSGNDPRATALKQAVINNNWKMISNDLRASWAGQGRGAESASTMAKASGEKPGVKGNEHDIDTFYVGVVVSKIAEHWTTAFLETEATSMSTMLNEWVQAEPSSLQCRVVRMEAFMRWAWKARTDAVIQRVSQRQALAFVMRLQHALAELKCLFDLGHRMHPLVVAGQITIGMGLGRRQSQIDVRTVLVNYEQQPHRTTDDIWNYSIYVRALQYFCAKWHGSHEQMFALARSVVARLPPGHFLWVLIPMAHFERAFGADVIETPYWKSPSLQQEVGHAYHQAFPPDSHETSWRYDEQLHPAEHSVERTTRTWFLYAMFMMGKYEEARRQVRLVGKRPSNGAPFHTIAKYRRVATGLGFGTEVVAEVVGEDSTTPTAEAVGEDSTIPIAEATLV